MKKAERLREISKQHRLEEQASARKQVLELYHNNILPDLYRAAEKGCNSVTLNIYKVLGVPVVTDYHNNILILELVKHLTDEGFYIPTLGFDITIDWEDRLSVRVPSGRPVRVRREIGVTDE